MPKRLEEALKREADERGYTGARRDRYIYGTIATLRKEGKIPEGRKDAARE